MADLDIGNYLRKNGFNHSQQSVDCVTDVLEACFARGLIPTLDASDGTTLRGANLAALPASGGGVVGPGNTVTRTSTLPGANTIEVADTVTANLTLAGNVTTEVAIARVSQVQFFGGGNMNGGSHAVGSFNYVFHAANGNTMAMAIGAECSLGLAAGATITRGNSILATINGMAATSVLSLWVGLNSSPTNVSSGASIPRSEGFRYEILPGSMLGAITLSIGAYIADSSTVTGAPKRQGFVNDDAGAPNKSKNPWIDSSFSALSPTNGGTTVIPPLTGLIVLNSGGTIASNTISLPANTVMEDGQEISFFNVAQITTITGYTTPGATPLGLPSTLAAGSFFKIKYAAAGPYWLRVG